MSKTLHAKKGGGPAVIRFKAKLVRISNMPKAESLALDFPKVVGKKLNGMAKIEGTINGHPFRAALEPNANGGHSVRVNKAMRNGSGAEAGDTVNLAILGPEPPPRLPADLRSALTASRDARAMWKDLADDARRIWIRWIESTNVAETRARRVRRTVEQLSEGKRRPCCVNVYEFMLGRVR
jgi:hypothetical protein